jgi:signal peptidase I
VLRGLGGVALALTALAALGVAVLVVLLKLAFAPVLSPSMEPVFGAGDLLVTRALDASAVQVGQVIVLPVPDAPGQRYVHRVVEVTQEDGKPVVRTQGDNNAAADPWALRIDSAQVPLVVGSAPDAGRLALLTQGTGLRIALILVVAGLALVGVKRALLD